MSTIQKARAVAWAHLVWILLVLGSLPLLLLFSWWRVPALVITVTTLVSWVLLRESWFLRVEKRCWSEIGIPFEETSFIAHYLYALFGIRVPRAVISISGGIYMAFLIAALVLKFL